MTTIVHAALGPSGTVGTIAPNFYSYVDFCSLSSADSAALAANPSATPALTGVTVFKGTNMGISVLGYIQNASTTDGHLVFPGINILTVQLGSVISTDQDIQDMKGFFAARRAVGWYVIALGQGPKADNAYNAQRAIINPQFQAMVGVYCDAYNVSSFTDADAFNQSYLYDGQHSTQLGDSIRAEVLRPVLSARISSAKVRRLVKIGS